MTFLFLGLFLDTFRRLGFAIVLARALVATIIAVETRGPTTRLALFGFSFRTLLLGLQFHDLG